MKEDKYKEKIEELRKINRRWEVVWVITMLLWLSTYILFDIGVFK